MTFDRKRSGGGVPLLFSVRAVAEATTVPASTWYTLIARGEIPVVRMGRAVRICEDDLLRWIEANRTTAT